MNSNSMNDAMKIIAFQTFLLLDFTVHRLKDLITR